MDSSNRKKIKLSHKSSCVSAEGFLKKRTYDEYLQQHSTSEFKTKERVKVLHKHTECSYIS